MIARGEACPLPGFGADSFELAYDELRGQKENELRDTIAAICASERARALRKEGCLADWDPSDDFAPGSPLSILLNLSSKFASPSARFCVESLVLNASAEVCGVAPCLLLQGCRTKYMETSAVVDPLSKSVYEQMRSLAERGVLTWKLKCGRDEARELALIRSLPDFLATIPASVSLRFDPNGAWEAQTLRHFAAAASNLELQWIEDPTSSYSDWAPILADEPSLCFAIDEPLFGVCPNRELLKRSGARVLVLKPQAIGGFTAAFHWARLAEELGLSLCISHLFDGPIAFDATVQLAFCLQSSHLAPGLGRHAALEAFGDEWPRPRFLQGNTLSRDGSTPAP